MSDLTDLNRYQRALEAVERRSPPNIQGSSAGHSLLAFESVVEHDFIEQRRLENLTLLRFGLLLSVAFYVLFFCVDALFWRNYHTPWAVVPILGVCSAINLGMLGLTWVERMQPVMSWLCAGTVLINSFAFSFASAHGYKVGVIIPPEAPVILQVYAVFLLNLQFRLAAPVAMLSLGVFLLLHSLVGMPGADYFYRCFMMVAGTLIGLLVCYLTERTQRVSWLRARLLRELSEHDSLTGLYNHRVFYQRGDQLLRQSRRDKVPVAVLVGDVDHFKTFNDSYGHLAGDGALRHVALALSRCARRPLDLAARLGGEEFGLLLYNVTPEAAHARAEEVRNIIRGLTLSEGHRVTISIGIAWVDVGTVTTIEALVGAADSALYRAKNAGRDRVSH